MTRSQAIEIVKHYGKDVPADAPNSFIAILEELGLIKFDIEITMPNGIQKILTNRQIKDLAFLMKKDAWEFVRSIDRDTSK